jgi:hypothetical protein
LQSLCRREHAHNLPQGMSPPPSRAQLKGVQGAPARPRYLLRWPHPKTRCIWHRPPATGPLRVCVFCAPGTSMEVAALAANVPVELGTGKVSPSMLPIAICRTARQTPPAMVTGQWRLHVCRHSEQPDLIPFRFIRQCSFVGCIHQFQASWRPAIAAKNETTAHRVW